MTKLIKLSDIHYIVVDDSEIKKGDFYAIANVSGEYRVYQCVRRSKDRVYFGSLHLEQLGQKSTISDDVNNCHKVVYSTNPFGYNGTIIINNKQRIRTIHLSDIEQLFYGYSSEILAEQKAETSDYLYDDHCGSCYNDYIEGYKEGFKKHQELVKAKSMNSDNQNHLQWIYNRLHFVYGENENYDFMIKFKNIIEFLTPSKTEWLIQVKDNKIYLI